MLYRSNLTVTELRVYEIPCITNPRFENNKTLIWTEGTHCSGVIPALFLLRWPDVLALCPIRHLTWRYVQQTNCSIARCPEQPTLESFARRISELQGAKARIMSPDYVHSWESAWAGFPTWLLSCTHELSQGFCLHLQRFDISINNRIFYDLESVGSPRWKWK